MLPLCLVAGACRLTQKSQDAANAVRQLDRVRVAVFVKAPRNEYDLVLDTARRAVKEKLPLVPEGALKQEITAALDAYQDAGQVWAQQDDEAQKNKDLTAVWTKYDLTKRLAAAPPAPTPSPTTSGVMPAPSSSAEAVNARTLIWQTAEEHLNKAKELLTKENRIF